MTLFHILIIYWKTFNLFKIVKQFNKKKQRISFKHDSCLSFVTNYNKVKEKSEILWQNIIDLCKFSSNIFNLFTLTTKQSKIKRNKEER